MLLQPLQSQTRHWHGRIMFSAKSSTYIIRYYNSIQATASFSSAPQIVRRGIMHHLFHFCRSKSTFSRRHIVICILSFLFLKIHPYLRPLLSTLHLQRLSTGSVHCSRSTTSVASHVRSVDALVVLNSVPLDTLPHLLDAEVELVLSLLLLVDEVVGVVCRLVRLAARLREGCCGAGRRWG